MSIVLGNEENITNEENVFEKATANLPGSNDKFITMNVEKLDYILIERMYEPKYNAFGCQAVGYSSKESTIAVVRIDHLKLMLETILKLFNVKEDLKDLDTLYEDEELKKIFPMSSKDSQKIIIKFTNSEIDSIGTNIESKFKFVYVLNEIINTLNGQENDMRTKATFQQFMMLLSSGMGPDKRVSEKGIIY